MSASLSAAGHRAEEVQTEQDVIENRNKRRGRAARTSSRPRRAPCQVFINRWLSAGSEGRTLSYGCLRQFCPLSLRLPANFSSSSSFPPPKATRATRATTTTAAAFTSRPSTKGGKEAEDGGDHVEPVEPERREDVRSQRAVIDMLKSAAVTADEIRGL
ncbi:unnamed protein product [Pleuronectes platessa]|uniref:Uncharacterized protein n=1 Tax=Pleuronectes platessa TaxID=8262 RepID=A0A9N7VEJ7_PLEPL|nr:unnamed protein product [Pleuronectes platessa]